MHDIDKKKTQKREKTLLTALLLSSPGPIVTGIAAITSRSATQIADFIRRTAELIALFVSWWVYRKLKQKEGANDTYSIRLEQIANFTVAGAMICSGVAMFVVGISRLFVFKVNGNVVMGFVIAVLGLITNSLFWWRYWTMARERFDSVIAGQEKLYRAKAFVDSVVVAALISVLVAPGHTITQYIDALGCIFVAFYLFYNGLIMFRKKKATESPTSNEVTKVD